MATLRIWETVRASHLNILRLDGRMTYQAFSFTGTAGRSAAFDTDTSVISVVSDANCALVVDNGNPTATVDGYPLESGVILDIEVQPGAKISAITTA